MLYKRGGESQGAYDIYVFMHVCIYHKHMYVCMNHAYVCLIVLFLLSLLHTHTHTYHTVFVSAYEVNVSRIILNVPNMIQLAALFGVGLGLIFDPASRRTLFRRISRGSRFFVFVFTHHQHRLHVFLILRVRHESTCHASRQI